MAFEEPPPTLFIDLPEISCSSCTSFLEESLEDQRNILNIGWKIDYETKILTVDFINPVDNQENPPLKGALSSSSAPFSMKERIQGLLDCLNNSRITYEVVQSANFSASENPYPDLCVESSDTAEDREINPVRMSKQKQNKDTFYHWLNALFGLTSGLALMILSLSGFVLPFSALGLLTGASIAFTILLGKSSFLHAWKTLWTPTRLNMDSLFSLSALAIMGLSVAALFIPGLPCMMDAGLLIFGFRHLGQGVKKTLSKKAQGNRRIQDRLPESVDKIVEEKIHSVALESLQPNDIIRVNPGDIIPADGLLDSDEALVVQDTRTGETKPVNVSKDQLLYSGYRAASTLDLRLVRKPGDSYLAKMDRQWERSQMEKAPIQKSVQRIFRYFIPAVLLLSLLCGTSLTLFFPLALAIKCAATILVSACPCILGLVVPMGIKEGMGKALEHGVIFKTPAALQAAGAVDCVVFDYNGTLTEGRSSVQAFHWYTDSLPESELKRLTLRLEQDSSHRVAIALRKYWGSSPDIPSLPASTQPKKQSGGVSGTIDGMLYRLGNRDYLEKHGVSFQNIPSSENGMETLYLARETQILGAYRLGDRLRLHTKKIIQALQRSGMVIHLCTGSDRHTASEVARKLGIPDINIAANHYPIANDGQENTKTAYIENLKEKYTVAMAGDGVNDWLALSASDLSIAMQISDEMTQEAANVLIMGETLLPVFHCLIIARQTLRNIKQNLYFNFTYNATSLLLSTVLLITLGISMNPAIGAALMVLQTCILLLNVYRQSQQKVENPVSDRSSNKRLPLRMNQEAEISNITPLPSKENRAYNAGFFNKLPNEKTRRSCCTFISPKRLGCSP